MKHLPRSGGWRRAPTACEMDARGSSLHTGSIFQSPEIRTRVMPDDHRGRRRCMSTARPRRQRPATSCRAVGHARGLRRWICASGCAPRLPSVAARSTRQGPATTVPDRAARAASRLVVQSPPCCSSPISNSACSRSPPPRSHRRSARPGSSSTPRSSTRRRGPARHGCKPSPLTARRRTATSRRARPRWRHSRRAGGGSSSKIGREVRFRGQTGKHVLILSLTAFDPSGSIHSTCLSALVADPAMEAWYHPSIA